MNEPTNIEILSARETCFFSEHGGVLAQWIEVTVHSRFSQPVAGRALIRAGGRQVQTNLELLPDQTTARCYAPALWPQPPDAQAVLELDAQGQVVSAGLTVGTQRPWVVYLHADVCTDDTWVYADHAALRKDDAELTYTELVLAEQTRSDPDWRNRNRYNLVHALSLEYFEEFYPGACDRLAEAIRCDEIALNPFYNMTLTQNISLEEQIRLFDTARRWMVKYNLPMRTANHQETPSIARDMPGILAGSGVEYLVKGILPYECPWAARLEEPPLFEWQGPDGSVVLVRRRNWDYVEGRFILSGLEKTNQVLHDTILPEYAALGARYPFDAVALLGCYGDLIPFEQGKPQSKDFPALKVETIRAYNAQEWQYPCLVNASHPQFLTEIKRQMAECGVRLERRRGDYGLGWDAWPACLAGDAAGWRRAQSQAETADRLAAVLKALEPGWLHTYGVDLAKGWRSLRLLADHAWNGASDANRKLNAGLRHAWQTDANLSFERVIDAGLRALAGRIPSGEAGRVMIWNSLAWKRVGLARVAGLPRGVQAVVRAEDGQRVPVQWTEEPNGPAAWIHPLSVPSLGYTTCVPVTAFDQTVEYPWKIEPFVLEGPFYRVEISPVTGGIARLYDKVRRREWLKQGADYHLNQAVLTVDEETTYAQVYEMMRSPVVNRPVEYTPAHASVELIDAGPLLARLRVKTEMKDIRLVTTITLYSRLDWIDIDNQVEKVVTSSKQELHFAFPFHLLEAEMRYDTPGALIDPRRDPLPGAGLSGAVVQHFVDVFNPEAGMRLAFQDSFLAQFGRRTTTEDPREVLVNGTVWAFALGNLYDANEAIRDQNGQTHFTFRFRLQGHAGGFDSGAALRMGWEARSKLLAEWIPPGRRGDLPAESCEFVSVTPDTVLLTGLKPAEEAGLIVRVWEHAGVATSAQIRFTPQLGATSAIQTDLLERDQAELPVQAGKVNLPVVGNGLATVRILPNSG